MAESKKYNESDITRIVDKLVSLKIDKEQAMEILEGLKDAIENKNSDYINEVCSRLSASSVDGENACDRFMSDAIIGPQLDEECKYLAFNYTTPEESAIFSSDPSTYIVALHNDLLSDGNACSHAYLYVDSAFEGLLDKDVDYLSEMGIRTIDIINVNSQETIYSGPLTTRTETRLVDKEKREGWFILIGVIIFICVGLMLKRKVG